MNANRIRLFPLLLLLVGLTFLLAIPVTANQPDSSLIFTTAFPWLIADPSFTDQVSGYTFLTAPQGALHNPPPHAQIYDYAPNTSKTRGC